MFGKIPLHMIKTLTRSSRDYRYLRKKTLFAFSTGNPHHNNRHDYHSHNDHHSDYSEKKFNQKMSFYFPFAAAFGALYGYAHRDNRISSHAVMCEGNVLNDNWSEKSSGASSMQKAVDEAEQLLQQLMLQHNCPGLVITVTVDGKEIWNKGFGFADVENRIRCSPSTVMRIASISKPMTMATVAKLWEEKKLDLDRPIQDYVPTWPEKYFDGKKVTITTRQLVSMLSGIRHYDKDCKGLESKKSKAGKSMKDKKKEKTETSNVKDDKEPDGDRSEKMIDKVDQDRDDNDKKQKKKDKKDDEKGKEEKDKKSNDKKKSKKDEQKENKSDAIHKEFYLKKHFSSVTESLSIFKDDKLCCEPGTEYLYSTHAWTLISAVVEGASGKKFPKVMLELFKELGLKNTYLDDPVTLIQNRARYYVINKNGKLSNAPYVDNSCKWAGGGLLSTSGDLCRFGNAMLHSFQASSANNITSFLQPETVKMIWSPVEKTKCGWDSFGSYGMGWGVVPPQECPRFTREQRQYFSHTGGAVGASSVLLILPRVKESVESRGSQRPPSGVVVAVIVNMQSVGMNQLALDIARIFEKIDDY